MLWYTFAMGVSSGPEQPSTRRRFARRVDVRLQGRSDPSSRFTPSPLPPSSTLSISMPFDTILDNDCASSDLEGDDSSLLGDSEGLVPASSSPLSSSPLPGTPPDNFDCHVSPLLDDDSLTVPSQYHLITASSNVNGTHTSTTTFSDASGWTKESQGRDISVSGSGSSGETEDPLADECIDSPECSSFASRLHDLLLVAQQERLSRRTVSLCSCPDVAPGPGSAARITTPPAVDSVNVAREVVHSPDYWSYFPESTSAAVSCNDGSVNSSSLSDVTSSAYSHSDSHPDAPNSNNGAGIHSALSVDPSPAEATICTPVISRKRSLGSACPPISTGHPTCDPATLSTGQDEPKKKRMKHEDEGDHPDVVSTRSKYFPRRPSLNIAAKQRAIAGADEDTAGFLPKRRMYARRAASLRRADSLRSETVSSSRELEKLEPKVSLHLHTCL